MTVVWPPSSRVYLPMLVGLRGFPDPWSEDTVIRHDIGQPRIHPNILINEMVTGKLITLGSKMLAVASKRPFCLAGDFEMILVYHFVEQDVVNEPLNANAFVPTGGSGGVRRVEQRGTQGDLQPAAIVGDVLAKSPAHAGRSCRSSSVAV